MTPPERDLREHIHRINATPAATSGGTFACYWKPGDEDPDPCAELARLLAASAPPSTHPGRRLAMGEQQTTFGGDKVAPLLYRDGRPDPDQPCRWVGQTARPWCIVHDDWWLGEGRCGAATPRTEASER